MLRQYLTWGNQGRVVKVNDAATALEFGAIGEGPSYTTFIALSDSPATYGSGSTYYSLTVNSANSAVVFSANNVTTTNSLTGGGNPNSPAWTALKLVNDTASPGNYYAYSTNSSGVKGWNLQAATPAGLTGWWKCGGQYQKSSGHGCGGAHHIQCKFSDNSIHNANGH